MPSDSNKKLSIFYVLKILKEYSDENHLLIQEDIAKKIYNLYGMVCERKSIGANIDALIDLDFDIRKTNKGSYLAEREFEPSEISFLVDAVFSCKSISGEHSQKLAKKLMSFLSVNERKNYNHIYNANKVTRTNNKQIFYTIDTINSAIEQNKKISFCYSRFYLDKQKADSQKTKVYTVSPYFFVNNQGKYYLVCAFDKRSDVANYRVDNIKSVNILENTRRPLTEIAGFEKGTDIADYVSKNQYMIPTIEVDATVKVLDDFAQNFVVDWFGDNARLYSRGDEVFANIKSGEQTLIYWCLQYGENIELVEPKDTREKLAKIVDQMNKRYN